MEEADGAAGVVLFPLLISLLSHLSLPSSLSLSLSASASFSPPLSALWLRFTRTFSDTPVPPQDVVNCRLFRIHACLSTFA